MPTLTVYRHGATMGTGNPSATPPLRTACVGWSASSIRRNVRFLYSVDERPLADLEGMALTLTVKVCPESGADWGRCRLAFLEALRRSGVQLVHWVTEWQRRGVPHLHLACYWQPHCTPNPEIIIAHWLRITSQYDSGRTSQHTARIFDALGWNQYTSKHAARGLHHYQRSPENVPKAWRGSSSGRMWGTSGTWPVSPPLPLDLTSQASWTYRRLVRGYRIAQARARALKVRSRSVRAARRMLACPSRHLSEVRGVSEWIPQAVQFRIIEAVAMVHPDCVESI